MGELDSSHIRHEKWKVLIRGKMIPGFHMGRQAKTIEVPEFGEIPTERLQPVLLFWIGIAPSLKLNLRWLTICPHGQIN